MAKKLYLTDGYNAILSAVEQACAEKKAILFGYTSLRNRTGEHEVDACQVIGKTLICWYPKHSSISTFRIDRITSLTVGNAYGEAQPWNENRKDGSAYVWANNKGGVKLLLDCANGAVRPMVISKTDLAAVTKDGRLSTVVNPNPLKS